MAQSVLSASALFRSLDAVTLTINPVDLIRIECVTVTTSMRKSPRWAQSSVSAILGDPLSPRAALQLHSNHGTHNKVAQTEDALDSLDRPAHGDSPQPSGPLTEAQSSEAAQTAGLVSPAGAQFEKWLGISSSQVVDLPAVAPVSAPWGYSRQGEAQKQDDPLINDFTDLRGRLKDNPDLHSLDALTIVKPFLGVIRSMLASASVTSLALISITKFLSYGVLSESSPGIVVAVQEVAVATSQCCFNSIDTSSDEIVILRMLRLMELLITGPVGKLLSDRSVCKLMESGLSLCCQTRSSSLLRRAAEMSMVASCQVIFERLKTLSSAESTGEQDSETVNTDNITMSVRGKLVAANQPKRSSEQEATDGQETPDEDSLDPFGLPSISEVFRALVDLLNPVANGRLEAAQTSLMRVTALRLVDATLEVAGPSIVSHSSLAGAARDQLCWNLLSLIRRGGVEVEEALRVMVKLLTVGRKILRLQQEMFLSFIIEHLIPSHPIAAHPLVPSTLQEELSNSVSIKAPTSSTKPPASRRDQLYRNDSASTRETFIETISSLVRLPGYITELYVHYDCDVNRENVCSKLIQLLCLLSLPEIKSVTTNCPALSLDVVLGIIQGMAEREECSETPAEVKRLRQQKKDKAAMAKGSEIFLKKPARGLEYFASQGLLSSTTDPGVIADFLTSCKTTNKKALGEYLTHEKNVPLLKEYVSRFDFSGKRIDEALRLMLRAFRLPGESQMIERLVDVFAKEYVRQVPSDILASSDAAYVLTYAIIMLNTDQHNPNASATIQPMTVDQFVNNLKGVNDGRNFDFDYLDAIYESIRSNEIILPDEHSNSTHQWESMLAGSDANVPLTLYSTNSGAFDRDIFAVIWRPVIATLAYVFTTAADKTVFYRVVLGFHQCAILAERYGMADAVDLIVGNLASITALESPDQPNTTLNTVVSVAGQTSVMVSETAVRFGRSFRAQLATILLFKIVSSNPSRVRNGWSPVSRVILNLFANALVPPPLGSIGNIPGLEISETFGERTLPALPPQPPAQVVDRVRQRDGLLSTFTSYVSLFTNDEPPAPSEQEIEFTVGTVACIEYCRIPALLQEAFKLDLDELKPLFHAFFSKIPEDPPTVFKVKTEFQPSSRSGSPAIPVVTTAPYDATLLYTLEIGTLLALRDDETMSAFGSEVADALHGIIRASPQAHDIIVARSAFYLLALLQRSDSFDFLRAPLILHNISQLDSGLLTKSATYILSGFELIFAASSAARARLVSSPDFWALLHSLYSSSEASPRVLGLLQKLVQDEVSPAVNADNFEKFLVLLTNFADMGSEGALEEQRRGLSRRALDATELPVVQHGKTALDIMFRMTGLVTSLIQKSQLDPPDAWEAYWLPVLQAISRQALNPCRQIRSTALFHLHRVLFRPEIVSADYAWTAIFSSALLPLMNQLLKPEVFQSDRLGMSPTRLEASRLLCRTFLHYLAELAGWDGLVALWDSILAVLDRLMNSGHENVREAVMESLKNIVLVMSSSDVLVPPRAPAPAAADENPLRARLWDRSCASLATFLPSLLPDLFPDSVVDGKIALYGVADEPGEEKGANENGSVPVGEGAGGPTGGENSGRVPEDVSGSAAEPDHGGVSITATPQALQAELSQSEELERAETAEERPVDAPVSRLGESVADLSFSVGCDADLITHSEVLRVIDGKVVSTRGKTMTDITDEDEVD